MSNPDRTIDSLIEEEPKRGLMLFGTDVSKIPCYRQTFLMGISGGIGVGLINFLLTSNPRKSSNRGVAGFGVITSLTWMICRYKYSRQIAMQEEFKQALQHRLSEGLDLDTNSKKDKIETHEV